MSEIFPEPITNLPQADIPLNGIKAYLSQAQARRNRNYYGQIQTKSPHFSFLSPKNLKKGKFMNARSPLKPLKIMNPT